MEQMEKLYDELTAENGKYQLSLNWETTKMLTQAGFGEYINPKKDCFEYNGYKIWWYHAENFKHPDTPVVVVEWTSNHK
jgi:hypothetical protein